MTTLEKGPAQLLSPLVAAIYTTQELANSCGKGISTRANEEQKIASRLCKVKHLQRFYCFEVFSMCVLGRIPKPYIINTFLKNK